MKNPVFYTTPSILRGKFADNKSLHGNGKIHVGPIARKERCLVGKSGRNGRVRRHEKRRANFT
jgi:hypothetical protein